MVRTAEGVPGEEQAAARERVIDNLGLAEGIARRYFRHDRARDEDLVQVAYIGLVKAAQRFDPGRGVAFPAFASPTISGEVKRHLRDHGWFVRPPREVQDLRQRSVRATGDLTQRLGHGPTPEEVATELGESVADVREAIACESHLRPLSLDVPAGEGGESTLGDFVPGTRDELGDAERSDDLRGALATLSARDREIVRLRFFEDRTQQDIADRVGVTQMQVSRILTRSLTTMRTRMRDPRAA